MRSFSIRHRMGPSTSSSPSHSTRRDAFEQACLPIPIIPPQRENPRRPHTTGSGQPTTKEAAQQQFSTGSINAAGECSLRLCRQEIVGGEIREQLFPSVWERRKCLLSRRVRTEPAKHLSDIMNTTIIYLALASMQKS